MMIYYLLMMIFSPNFGTAHYKLDLMLFFFPIFMFDLLKYQELCYVILIDKMRITIQLHQVHKI